MPDYQFCDGLGDARGDHCCWLEGTPCPHLQVDGPTGRRYACGLLVELGSWDAVHADARYLADVKPVWDRTGTVGCGPWWGPQREVAVALRTSGVTDEAIVQHAQCCAARRWAGLSAQQKRTVKRRIEQIIDGPQAV